VSQIRGCARDWILRGEICSLFHDLRKLDSRFIRYRQTWYSDPKGYSSGDPDRAADPHERSFASDAETIADFGVVARLQQTVDLAAPGEASTQVSPDSTIRDHVCGTGSLYMEALKAGDSLDSAQDRNNPLWSSEQNDRTRSLASNQSIGHFYRSNIFGDETRVETADLDTHRGSLYAALAEDGLLAACWPGPPDRELRRRLLEILKIDYEKGCSDTTRPSNDTSLWEHVYAVASITKALQAHYVLHRCREVLGNGIWKSEPFILWGLGWDAVRFIARGQRIADLGARRELLRKIRAECREIVEYEEALGNAVYEDDGSLVFLLPVGSDLPGLQRRVEDVCLKESGDELCPHFKSLGPTRDTTATAQLLKDLQSDLARAAFHLSGASARGVAAAIHAEWSENPANDVCPICGLRPSHALVQVGRICTICERRRSEWRRDERGNQGGTPGVPRLTAEIADGNGRVALLVAGFGLHDWLSGRMIRSLFVSEARSLDKEVAELGLARQFEQDETRLARSRPNWPHNFPQIKREVLACFKLQEQGPGALSKDELALARNSYFLYGRRTAGENTINRGPSEAKNEWDWRTDGFSSKEDELVNRLNAKTPTPSSVLDVWETTGEFFASLCRDVLDQETVPDHLRGFAIANKIPDGVADFAVHSGHVEDAGPIEFYLDDCEKRHLVLVGSKSAADLAKFGGKRLSRIRLDGRDIDGSIQLGAIRAKPFRPVREILATPSIFLALVPAERAVDASLRIYHEFGCRFGKVRTRLPFSLGNLFFSDHYPMFLALDAARRMLERFGRVESAVRTKGELGYTIPDKLGDCRTDYHHPYVFIGATEGSDRTECPSYVPAPGGAVVHISDLRDTERIRLAPSVYDFEFLAHSASRFDLSAEGRVEVRLEELDQGIVRTWKLLRQLGFEDTELRSLLARLEQKRAAWGVHLPLPCEKARDAGQAEWAALVEVELRERFGKHQDFFRCQIQSGLFFRTAQLYLQALRARLENQPLTPAAARAAGV